MALRSCNLSPSSPYASWPRPLIQTLCRSYQAHSTSVPTLPGAFKFASEVEPANFEEALRLGAVDVVKLVYDRMSRYPPFWAFIDLIYHAYHVSHLDGFDFSLESAGRKLDLVQFLNSSPRFCRDTRIGQTYHQARSSPADKFLGQTHTCWREVVRGLPGLHICIPGGSLAPGVPGPFSGVQGMPSRFSGLTYDCTIHIDEHQCVLAKAGDGTCDYDPVSTAQHLLDVYGPTLPIVGPYIKGKKI